MLSTLIHCMVRVERGQSERDWIQACKVGRTRKYSVGVPNLDKHFSS